MPSNDCLQECGLRNPWEIIITSPVEIIIIIQKTVMISYNTLTLPCGSQLVCPHSS